MADVALRALERRLEEAPSDAALAAQVVAARRRAGLPVPWRVLARRALPPGAVSAVAALEVESLPVGAAGPFAPGVAAGRLSLTERRWVRLPARCAWRARLLARDLGPPERADLEAAVAPLAAAAWPEDDPPALVLGARRLGAAGLAPLAALPFVRALRLEGGLLGPAGLAALEALPALERLDLAGVVVDPQAFARLARLRLAGLTLGEGLAGAVDLRALLGATRLVELDLGPLPVDDAALAALVGLPALEALAVDARALVGPGLEAALAAGRLRALDLRGASHLRGRLRTLDARGCVVRAT